MSGSSVAFTDRQLKFSYWYISHKLVIRRYTAIFLFIAAVLFWLFFGWQMGDFLINYNTDQYRLSHLLFSGSPYLDVLDKNRPQNLIISDTQSFAEDNGRYDFLAAIKNSNPNWIIIFDYRFREEGKENSFKRGFIMPGEEKYLMDLGHDGGASQLEITNQSWKKVNNVQNILNSRMRFEVSDEKLFAGNAASGEPNRVVFNLANYSAFGFWNIGAQVYLYSGGNIISINFIDLKQFKAGEKRTVEVDWNYRLPAIDSIQVIPDLNVFDENNIMPPGA